MSLKSGRKNIHIDNDDDDDEDESIEEGEEDEDNTDVEEEEEDEEDDEPDFMDNSGKCWEFASKIVDEKHLKEWCKNKIGGMIVGKEEKLTRQFHCQNKECQFKAIFVKSCSIIYTRNKHNHVVKIEENIQQKKERINPPSTQFGKDYVDREGKFWSFRAQIGKNVPQRLLLTKFGFSHIRKNQRTLNLNCQKFNPYGERCPFAGIYLKSNGCLYTRGKHEHTKKGKLPQNVGDDFVDNFGKKWPFHSKISKHTITNGIWLSKFGFSIRHRPKTLYLYCQKRTINGGTCLFSGIYIKENGCLYIRGKHEHTKNGKTPQNIGDDYVDRRGNIWKFNREIGKKIQPQLFNTEFGFYGIKKSETGLNLYCAKTGPNERCKFAGVYLNANGCLYTRGKHEHKHAGRNSKPNVGDDYVDHFGKVWPFHAKICKISNEILRNKFGFTKIYQKQQTLNLYCKNKTTNGGKCPFTGVYLKLNECLYIRGKHEHK